MKKKLICLFISFVLLGVINFTFADNPNVSKKNNSAQEKKSSETSVDFAPFMKKLQRDIKLNWKPPKKNESNRVVLLFTVSKNGKVSNIKVLKSSGYKDVDKAAIKAVKDTAPFQPLPAEFEDNQVDIHFKFDYNVFHK